MLDADDVIRAAERARRRGFVLRWNDGLSGEGDLPPASLLGPEGAMGMGMGAGASYSASSLPLGAQPGTLQGQGKGANDQPDASAGAGAPVRGLVVSSNRALTPVARAGAFDLTDPAQAASSSSPKHGQPAGGHHGPPPSSASAASTAAETSSRLSRGRGHPSPLGPIRAPGSALGQGQRQGQGLGQPSLVSLGESVQA